jgi:hypothetical protein
MSIGKTGGLNNFQLLADQANFAKTRSVSAEQGQVAAQNSGRTSEKSKESQVGERFTLSETLQAQLAREKECLSDDLDTAKAGMADKANQSHSDKKAKEKEREIGESVVQLKKEPRVFELDDESGETYQVSEAQSDRLDALDKRTPEQIMEGMPGHAKAAAQATLTSQLETKGMKKVSNLKDDPRVSAQVEDMLLELTDRSWQDNTLASIESSKHIQPLNVEDPHALETAKGAAIEQMQSQGGEQLIAS